MAQTGDAKQRSVRYSVAGLQGFNGPGTFLRRPATSPFGPATFPRRLGTFPRRPGAVWDSLGPEGPRNDRKHVVTSTLRQAQGPSLATATGPTGMTKDPTVMTAKGQTGHDTEGFRFFYIFVVVKHLCLETITAHRPACTPDAGSTVGKDCGGAGTD